MQIFWTRNKEGNYQRSKILLYMPNSNIIHTRYNSNMTKTKLNKMRNLIIIKYPISKKELQCLSYSILQHINLSFIEISNNCKIYVKN